MKECQEVLDIIHGLSLVPGKCTKTGCAEGLLCVSMESWDGKDSTPIPPPRFACPKHDVWLGDCFDAGYPDDPTYQGGLYLATLRDPRALAFSWLPEEMRSAAATAGFCVDNPDDFRSPMLTVFAGRTWGTDGKTLLAIGGAEELDKFKQGLIGECFPASAREEALARHMLPSPEKAVGDLSSYSAATVRLPSEAGFNPKRWDPWGVVIGSALFPRRKIEMVDAIYPGVEWRAVLGNPESPALGWHDGGPVVLVMRMSAHVGLCDEPSDDMPGLSCIRPMLHDGECRFDAQEAIRRGCMPEMHGYNDDGEPIVTLHPGAP